MDKKKLGIGMLTGIFKILFLIKYSTVGPQRIFIDYEIKEMQREKLFVEMSFLSLIHFYK